jgi:hypothetical protein
MITRILLVLPNSTTVADLSDAIAFLENYREDYPELAFYFETEEYAPAAIPSRYIDRIFRVSDARAIPKELSAIRDAVLGGY